MANSALLTVRDNLVEGVTVVELVPREMTEPDEAARLGEALRAVSDTLVIKRLLIDATATKYMSSTAFAVLLSFGRKANESGLKIAISGMDPFVKVGADIIKMGRVIPIFEDEASALASLIL